MEKDFAQSIEDEVKGVDIKNDLQAPTETIARRKLENFRVVPESMSYESHVRDELLAKAVLLKQAGIIDAVDYIFRTQVINPPTP